MIRIAKHSLGLALMGSALLALSVQAENTGAAKSPAATAQASPATNPGTVPSTSTTPSAPVTPGSQAMTLTDGQILGVVNAVDQHEIDAAKAAMKEKMGKDAKDFAKMLKDQHTANMQKGKKVGKQLNIKAATSPLADSLKAKGEADVKTMAAMDGAAFEKAYIDAMVKGHTDALQMLDERLIPGAQNAEFKTHLNEVRGHISAHLEQGKRLQGAQASVPAQP